MKAGMFRSIRPSAWCQFPGIQPSYFRNAGKLGTPFPINKQAVKQANKQAIKQALRTGQYSDDAFAREHKPTRSLCMYAFHHKYCEDPDLNVFDGWTPTVETNVRYTIPEGERWLSLCWDRTLSNRQSSRHYGTSPPPPPPPPPPPSTPRHPPQDHKAEVRKLKSSKTRPP